MKTIDETIAAYEAGETWNDDDEIVKLEVRRPLDKVIPVRLSDEQWTALRAEARELGIGPSTLMRMWVLERLRRQSADSVPATEGEVRQGSVRRRPEVS